jgi:hypothetical protein
MRGFCNWVDCNKYGQTGEMQGQRTSTVILNPEIGANFYMPASAILTDSQKNSFLFHKEARYDRPLLLFQIPLLRKAQSYSN